MFEKLVFFVEVKIARQRGDEACYLLDGVLGGFRSLFFLQTHHQHPVEGCEAGLYFAHGGIAGLRAQLDDEGEGAVEFRSVFRKFRI